VELGKHQKRQTDGGSSDTRGSVSEKQTGPTGSSLSAFTSLRGRDKETALAAGGFMLGFHREPFKIPPQSREENWVVTDQPGETASSRQRRVQPGLRFIKETPGRFEE